MGAPMIATAAANTRTGRRIIIGVATALLVAAGLLMSPLIAIPFAVAGQSVSAAVEQAPGGVPVVKGTWGYPLAGSYHKGRGYGYHPLAGCGYCSTNHKGYDMSQECGAPIYAAGSGEVITAGVYYGYGNAVRINHGGGLVTIYGHMQWGSLRVHTGQHVTAGTPLGAEGNTGRSFGCHLHLEIRLHGASVDPEPFMAARGLPLT